MPPFSEPEEEQPPDENASVGLCTCSTSYRFSFEPQLSGGNLVKPPVFDVDGSDDVEPIIIDSDDEDDVEHIIIDSDDEYDDHGKGQSTGGDPKLTSFALSETPGETIVVDEDDAGCANLENSAKEGSDDAQTFILSDAQWDFCRRLKLSF